MFSRYSRFSHRAKLFPVPLKENELQLNVTEMDLTYLDFFHFLERLRDHAKLQTDEGDVALDTSRSFVDQPVVIFQDCLGLHQAFQSVIKLARFLLKLGKSDRDVCEELRIGVLLKL